MAASACARGFSLSFPKAYHADSGPLKEIVLLPQVIQEKNIF
jgi:hypothetical protein